MSATRLEMTDRGPTVIHDGRYLYSKRDPVRTPERIAQTVPGEERCLYLLPSPLLGYGLEILAERIPENSMILAFEFSIEIFALCTPEIPQRLLNHPLIEWARLSDTPSMAVLLDRIGLWKFRRIKRVDINGGVSVHPELYNSLCDFAEGRLVNYWKNRHTLGRMGRSWIRHLFSNLIAASRADLTPGKSFSGPSSQMTVIVGAGPSLDESLTFLKQHRKLIRIISTDTALSSLLSSGIRPDAVSILETQAWNLLDFHGAVNSGIPLLADMTSYPPSMTVTGGPLIPFSTAFAELNLFDRLKKANLRPIPLAPLGSVGLSSVELAIRLFSGPIILVGIDFGYMPGKSHARGTSVHQWQLITRNRTDPYPGFHASVLRPKIMARDAQKKPYRTDGVLKGYADLFIDCYAKDERIFLLEPGGIDLSRPLISASEAAELAWKAASQETSPPAVDREKQNKNPFTPEPEPTLPQSAAADFLRGERERFNRVIEAWDCYALKQGSSEAIVKALGQIDYIYCDFPDDPPLPKDETSFLVRAVKRVRELKRLMERSDI